MDKGMQISTVNKAFRTELDALGVNLRAQWAKKAGTDAKKILDEYYIITGRKK